MATEAVGRDLAVIDLYIFPACRVMAVQALVRGRWMIAALARRCLAVMAGKAGSRSTFELGSRMACFAPYIDMLAGQRKVGPGVVEILVDHCFCGSRPASQHEKHKQRHNATQGGIGDCGI